jgi:hypothetical protein
MSMALSFPPDRYMTGERRRGDLFTPPFADYLE